ncbi:hypothetical protein CFIMG_006165RA [Ceratocystis fimbriata CBS 114723]|uniref:Uncharacterized protein n=1 Tax=Ceratocystis fimbriata CBS 114723 TaxID=1035309 RepID=A0A2C5WVV1_9PEZI|nr:hypothetical protein CFIMG_006165RA [Ceratocystis fimbriata CBS 114723]
MVDHGVVEDPIKVSHSSLQFNVSEMLSSGIVFFNRPHWQITALSTTDVDDGMLQDSTRSIEINRTDALTNQKNLAQNLVK